MVDRREDPKLKAHVKTKVMKCATIKKLKNEPNVM